MQYLFNIYQQNTLQGGLDVFQLSISQEVPSGQRCEILTSHVLNFPTCLSCSLFRCYSWGSHNSVKILKMANKRLRTRALYTYRWYIEPEQSREEQHVILSSFIYWSALLLDSLSTEDIDSLCFSSIYNKRRHCST